MHIPATSSGEIRVENLLRKWSESSATGSRPPVAKRLACFVCLERWQDRFAQYLQLVLQFFGILPRRLQVDRNPVFGQTATLCEMNPSRHFPDVVFESFGWSRDSFNRQAGGRKIAHNHPEPLIRSGPGRDDAKQKHGDNPAISAAEIGLGHGLAPGNFFEILFSLLCHVSQEMQFFLVVVKYAVDWADTANGKLVSVLRRGVCPRPTVRLASRPIHLGGAPSCPCGGGAGRA